MGFPFRSEKIIRYLTGKFVLGGILPDDGYIVGVPKKILIDTTDRANSGSGETTIETVTFPAGTLKSNGDYLEYVGEYDLVSVGVTKTIRYKFGGQNFNANPWNNTLASTQITEIGRLYRVSATTCRCYIACSLPFAGQSNPFTQFGDITVSNMDTNSLDFAVTIQGTSNADITQRVGHLFLTRS